ncbi:MAG TPA: HlyC/CorC family transporter [Casimicrobiaceae bacterium]|nr:HlyC/CorC family transporter [Casimicrobiaceae bacterium]
MDDIPLSTLVISLVALLAVSGFFSIAETAMMAVNRHRLRLKAKHGERGAKVALGLLARTDKLLGVILLGNTLVNAIATTLTAVITTRLFGQSEASLMVGGVAIALAILIFSEITPKVVGAAYADRIAPPVGFLLAPMLRLSYPVVWFVNLFVQGLLILLRLKPGEEVEARLSQEEVRSLVLEGHFFRGKHRAMLANLFDLASVSVDDVMTPRNQIEAIDLTEKPALLAQQLATSYHTMLPVYEDSLDNIVGLLHLKQVLRLRQADEIDAEQLRGILRAPYFIPAGTPLLTQLHQFQVDRQRLGLVVDEYGELKGLVSIEDILEEIVGEFTTQGPGGSDVFRREADGSVIVDGMAPLRMLNRKLGTEFPLEGPKTLNGLIVEYLGEIPDSGISFRLAGQGVEVLQVQDRAVKVVKLLPPVGRAPAPPLQTTGEQASSIS